MIAHLSDSHLIAGPLGAGPAAALHRAFGRLLALEPRPDCVVITGDMVETEDPAEYAILRDILDRCPIPVHLVAGNHDGKQLTVEFAGTRYLAGGSSTTYRVDYPEAAVLVVDSVLPGRPEGELGAEQLRWIDEALAARPGVPAFLCLHHPPADVGIPFLDGMGLLDGPALGEVVARHGTLTRILAGHVHRNVAVPFAGTLVSIAPAAYRQSHLRLHDAGPPGYLVEPTSFLLHVLTDGGCATHTVPVSDAGAVLAY